MTDISLTDQLQPGETWQTSVERRLRELTAAKPSLGDLPLAQLQRKLENDWQPDGSILLQPKSVSPAMLSSQPIQIESAAGGDETTASAAYADLATVGPTLTIPVSGLWVIETIFEGFHGTPGAHCLMSYAIGASAAVDADSADIAPGVANTDVLTGHRVKHKQLTASTVLTCKYRTTSGTATFRNATGGLGQPRTIRATLIG